MMNHRSMLQIIRFPSSKTSSGSNAMNTQSLLKNRRGSIAMMTAILIPLLLGGIAFAIELSRYLHIKSLVGAAIDHAALSSVILDQQDRVQNVQEVFNLNFPQNYRSFVELTSVDVSEINFAAASTNALNPGDALEIKVDVRGSIQTSFGSLLGVDKVDFNYSSKAAREVFNGEIVMTMSVAGTMCAEKIALPNGTQDILPGDVLISLRPDRNCTDFNGLKDAMRTFLDIVETNLQVANARIGVIPYNVKVQFPDPSLVPPSLAPGVAQGGDEATFYSVPPTNGAPVPQLVPLVNNGAAIRSMIDNFTLTPEATAWSRPNVAAHVAGLMLDPEHHRYFPGGAEPTNFGNDKVKKILILMSDGISSGCCFTNWPEGQFRNQYVYSYRPDLDELENTCRLLKENGVEIFTVLFGVNDGQSGAEEINNAFARCASGEYAEPDKEKNPGIMLKCDLKTNCYKADNVDRLMTAYEDIALTLSTPRIVE